MRSQAARSKWVLGVSTPLALVAALVWARSERGGGTRALETDAPRASESPETVDLDLAAGPDTSPVAVPELEPSAPPERTEVAEGPEPRTTPEPPVVDPPLPVFGVILDQRGRPMPGVGVGVRRGSPRAATGRRHEWSRTSTPSSSPPGVPRETRLTFARAGVDRVEVTDLYGVFELPGVNARDGGELVFAAELFMGEPPRQALIPDGAQQVLFLPSRPARTPLVVVHLTNDRTGARVFPYGVDAQLTALLPPPADPASHTGPPPPTRGRRQPQAGQVHRQDGRVELELWPGRWRLSLSTERSSTVDVDLVVPLEGPAVEVDARVTVFDERDGWELLDPATLGGPALAADPALGFDAYGPEHYHERELGDRRSDSHFRRTLRFGPGAVSSARLELDLEAASGMAHNDGLHLEFSGQHGAPRFRFSTSLTALAGRKWRPPLRRTFDLNLADLPGRDGPVNLLDDLADGRLDVYIADDTAVHGLRLFVRR